MATARVVAVVSDGSGIVDDPAIGPVSPGAGPACGVDRGVCWPPTTVIALASGGHLTNVLDGLPDKVGAVFLPYTEHHRAVRAQAMVSRTPVVTGQDTTAVALVAALLTTLNRAGHAPEAARVVIAGEQTPQVLCPLLIAAGVGDITTWNPADAIAFPLSRITAGSHAVITLPGGRADAVDAAVRSATGRRAFAGLPANRDPAGREPVGRWLVSPCRRPGRHAGVPGRRRRACGCRGYASCGAIRCGRGQRRCPGNLRRHPGRQCRLSRGVAERAPAGIQHPAVRANSLSVGFELAVDRRRNGKTSFSTRISPGQQTILTWMATDIWAYG